MAYLFLMASEPFSINVENVREDLQLELIDLQCDTVFQKFLNILETIIQN